ncbi:MAG: MscL family protein [Candidatus Micrarchaeales archaeon]
MSIIKEFKDFLLQGTVLGLAVSVVIGLALTNVVTALVVDLITPIIGIFGHQNFMYATITINGSQFLIGAFLNSVISFIIILVVVFFFIVKPSERLKPIAKPPAEEPTKQCPECMARVPVNARRCMYCTSKLH